MKILNKTIFFLFIVLLSGCAGKDITRVVPEKELDLSGRWNDTDSKLIADKLIEDMLQSAWHKNFRDKYGRKPVVITGRIRNKTMEHIPVETFIKDLERAMLNSGKIEIVASSKERKEVRSEREDMQRWASISSRKEIMEETAADYILKGVLNTIVDEEGGKKVIFYQADMNLINLQNNSIIWAGQKKIKKYIKKSKFRF